MTTKAFVALLVAVLVLGGSLGGAFAGGVALGKSQGKAAAVTTQTTQSTTGGTQQTQGQGQFTQEQIQQFRQQFQGQGGTGTTGLRGGLTGTIEKVDANTITVNTAQGPLQATIGASTTIGKVGVGTVADLASGAQVTVVGQRGQDGTVTAQSIIITPAGMQNPLGGGLLGQRQQQTPTP